jgi:hypothetical protein
MQPPENLVPDHEHRCRFVKTSGARCTMPALRDDRLSLCFAHHAQLERTRLRVNRPPALDGNFHLVPLIQFSWVADHADILENLNQIADALVRGVIDVRQANSLTTLMTTCLRALRQSRALDQIEEPVRAFVQEQGLNLVTPEDAGLPPTPLSPLDALNWDKSTEEGRHNIHQRMLWTYFRLTPENGVSVGLDLKWAGGVAFRQASPTPTGDDTDSPVAPTPSTGGNLPSVTAAACPASALVTPAQSTLSLECPGNPSFSTLKPSVSGNSFLSHTYENASNSFRSRPSPRLAPRFARKTAGLAPQTHPTFPLSRLHSSR